MAPRNELPAVNIGDTVLFTTETNAVQGEISMIPVHTTTPELGLRVAGRKYSVRELSRMGFEAKVIRRAKHRLPEKAGLYKTDDSTTYLQLVRPPEDPAYWEVMGREGKIAHRELPYSTLPLILIEET